MRKPQRTQKYSHVLCFTLIIAGLSFKSLAQDSSALPALDSLPSLFLTSLSPVILNKDGIEINNYNALTSFWLAVQETPPELSGAAITNRYRATYFVKYVRVSYGFSYSKRWDLGAEFRFLHQRLDDDATSSPLKIFSSDTPSSSSYSGLSMVGARVRYMPFQSVPELTLQGALTFPVAKEEMREALKLDRTEFDFGATYYKNLNKTTYYFLQSNWMMRFARAEDDRTTHLWSASAFLVESLFHHRIYVYPGMTYSGLFQRFSDSGFSQVNYQVLGGLGLQYQPNRVVSISIYGQIPFIFESGSATTEWVRESYSSWTLGLLFRF
jgi:hypothetical protein